ncbi:hypothetical protein [Marinobacter sp.]|uniref:hypothetical protein n=1 Tax=Marinobacter sp. TaxID=50741 RepID=UPI0035C6EB21
MRQLPGKTTVAGAVLRLMIDGRARTKLQITEELGLHPAKEVTARLRDFRKPEKDGGFGMHVTCVSHHENGQRLDVYRVAWCPAWIRKAIRDESRADEEAVA